MLNLYLNQTAEYKACKGTDNRGNTIFDDTIEIKCRKQAKTKQILTSTQQVVTTNHIYYTQNSVKIGDKLDDKFVIAVDDWIDLNGKNIGYKAVL